jgi:cytochrome c-type biogenesis protein CcmH/NrfG
VMEIAGADMDKQIDTAFRLALSRGATEFEKAKARPLYATSANTRRTPEEALARLATVLFNLNEFLYLE